MRNKHDLSQEEKSMSISNEVYKLALLFIAKVAHLVVLIYHHSSAEALIDLAKIYFNSLVGNLVDCINGFFVWYYISTLRAKN